jgi:outer membrane usher protein
VVPGVGIFPTLPVQSSFGVIRMKGVAGVRGFGNGQDVGSTDRNGNLIVPNLLAHYGNQLSVDTESIPVDYELQGTDMLLGPPTRGVAIADFVLTQPHYYRGTLVVDVGGKRVAPKFGELQVLDLDPPLLSPLGALGEFELEGLVAGPHELRVDYEGGLCDVVVDVPEGQGPVIELGEIVCVQAPPAVGPRH